MRFGGSCISPNLILWLRDIEPIVEDSSIFTNYTYLVPIGIENSNDRCVYCIRFGRWNVRTLIVFGMYDRGSVSEWRSSNDYDY